MSFVLIREGPYYRGFFKKKCMRILSVHGKLSVIERCPHGEVRLYHLTIDQSHATLGYAWLGKNRDGHATSYAKLQKA